MYNVEIYYGLRDERRENHIDDSSSAYYVVKPNGMAYRVCRKYVKIDRI